MTHEEIPEGRPAGHQPRQRRREPVFNMPGVVLFFVGLCAAIYLAQTYLLDQQQNVFVLRHFAFIPLLYTGGYALDVYAFIAPLSYSLLHGGVAHVVVNMVWLVAFGSPLAARIGPLRFLLFWAFTAVAAVALHFALNSSDPTPLIGASGAISGMMGAAARFAFRIDRSRGKPAFAGEPLPFGKVFRSRITVTFLAVWVIIDIVTGISGLGAPGGAQIAWEAHIGGFVAGFLFIRFFDRPQLAETPADPASGDTEQT